MRGEELEGLSVEELLQMERKLEAGLHRVLSTKDQLFMQQISELQQKVRNDYINLIAFVNCLFQSIHSRKLVKLGALMF